MRFGKMLGLMSAVLVALAAIACEDEVPTPPASAGDATARRSPPPSAGTASAPVSSEVPGEATAPAAEETPGEVTNGYRAEGKRDPFRSFHLKEVQEPVLELGPLADFDLAQLALVGVVWNTTNPRALVADPGGRSFVLSEGSQIGKNGGRVTRIQDDSILVQERFVDFEGKVTTKDVEMRIKKGQGG